MISVERGRVEKAREGENEKHLMNSILEMISPYTQTVSVPPNILH